VSNHLSTCRRRRARMCVRSNQTAQHSGRGSRLCQSLLSRVELDCSFTRVTKRHRLRLQHQQAECLASHTPDDDACLIAPRSTIHAPAARRLRSPANQAAPPFNRQLQPCLVQPGSVAPQPNAFMTSTAHHPVTNALLLTNVRQPDGARVDGHSPQRTRIAH
jgi:hypothetical protein